MSKPTYIAYVVSRPEREGDEPVWRAIGAVWPHGKGDGFDLIIHDQISVSGRIVCRVRKDKPAADKAA